MVASTDGFELAEKDLEIRGGGALLGRASRVSPTSASPGSRTTASCSNGPARRRRRCRRDDAAEVDALLGESSTSARPEYG